MNVRYVVSFPISGASTGIIEPHRLHGVPAMEAITPWARGEFEHRLAELDRMSCPSRGKPMCLNRTCTVRERSETPGAKLWGEWGGWR